MQKLARRVPKLDGDVLLWLVLRGLRPHIKAYILQQPNLETISDVAEAAKIAETAGISAGDLNDAGVTALMNEVRASRAEVQQMASYHDHQHRNVAQRTGESPSPTRCARARTSVNHTVLQASGDHKGLGNEVIVTDVAGIMWEFAKLLT